MKQRNFQRNNDESAFLGLFTGKRVRAKADAAVQKAEAAAAQAKAEADAKIALLQAQTAAAQAGYKSDETKKIEAETATKTVEAQSSNTLYYVIGGIVLAVVALVIILKK